MDIKVYNQMASTSAKGKLKDKSATIQVKGIKMTSERADTLNKMYKNSGRFYKVDESATKELLKVIEKGNK